MILCFIFSSFTISLHLLVYVSNLLLHAKNYNELTINLKKSIKNIKKDHYKNYFIYAYNKDFYKGKKGSKKSSKRRKSKIYKP